MTWFIHLWRLILSWTVFRKVEHEQDEVETEDTTDSSSPEMGSPPLPVSLAEAEAEPEVETQPERLPPPPVSVPAPSSPELPLPAEPPAPVDAKEEFPTQPTVVVPRELPPLEIDDKGWLVGPKVVRVPTKRGSYTFRTANKKAAGCLWHWTATSHNTALTMARRIVDGPGSSVHAWLEHDGTIYQSQAFTRGTGHAGGDSSLRVSEDKKGDRGVVANPASKSSVNSYLLGFEIVCVGEVRLVVKIDDGSYVRYKAGVHDIKKALYMGWPFGVWKQKKDKNGDPMFDKNGKKVMYVAKGPVVKSSEVVEGVDHEGVKRCYQEYTQGQLDAAERMIRAMHKKYGWSAARMSWGHVDVDPKRKSDPGPRWKKHWLPQLLARVLGA